MLRDICRADGPPTSQPELVRLPGQEREVNIFLREATRRLQQPAQRTRQLTTNPKTRTPSPKPKPKPNPNQTASGRSGRDMGRRRHIPGGPAAGAPNPNPSPRARTLALTEPEPTPEPEP